VVVSGRDPVVKERKRRQSKLRRLQQEQERKRGNQFLKLDDQGEVLDLESYSGLVLSL